MPPAAGATDDGTRFRDDTYGYWSFTDADLLVVCPGCGCPALVRIVERDDRFLLRSKREMVCGRCLLRRRDHTSVLHRDGARDPFFREQLWLQTSCGGHVLWALNEAHIAFLRDVVRARLRENATGSHVTENYSGRLPRWVLARKNRPEVLAALDRLDALAAEHHRRR